MCVNSLEKDTDWLNGFETAVQMNRIKEKPSLYVPDHLSELKNIHRHINWVAGFKLGIRELIVRKGRTSAEFIHPVTGKKITIRRQGKISEAAIMKLAGRKGWDWSRPSGFDMSICWAWAGTKNGERIYKSGTIEP